MSLDVDRQGCSVGMGLDSPQPLHPGGIEIRILLWPFRKRWVRVPTRPDKIFLIFFFGPFGGFPGGSFFLRVYKTIKASKRYIQSSTHDWVFFNFIEFGA